MEWSREVAYLIGLAITDGSVSEKDYQARGYVMRSRVVEWQVKDRELLEIIQRITATQRAIDVCNRKHGTYYRLRLQGQHWVDAFKAKGVHPCKTMTCRVPADLPESLRWHFLRGVLDGDGAVMVRSGGYLNRPDYRRLSASISSGSREFLDDLQEWAGGKARRHSKVGHAVNVLEWDCGEAWKLLQKVYEDSEGLRLERKHDVWSALRESGQTYRTAA